MGRLPGASCSSRGPTELLEVYVLSFVSVMRVIEGLMMYVGALYTLYILWILCGVLRFFFLRSWCVQPKNWCVDERFWAIRLCLQMYACIVFYYISVMFEHALVTVCWISGFSLKATTNNISSRHTERRTIYWVQRVAYLVAPVGKCDKFMRSRSAT